MQLHSLIEALLSAKGTRDTGINAQFNDLADEILQSITVN
jgi:hypothetical protein